MKSVLFYCLTTLFLAAAQARAEPDTNPAKTRALELRNALKTFAGGNFRSAPWDEVRAGIDHYQKEFGVTAATDNNLVLLRKFQLSLAGKFPDQAPYLSLLKQLADDPLPAVAKMAAERLEVHKRVEDLKTKPIELKFTAVDGTAVDLAAMRGKVVLIDFWASWCPDCSSSAAEIVSTWEKYRDRGFAVVGISLDENKDAMVAFAKNHGMTWPQYFDGGKWENQVSQSLGIASIPALWVVDRKGFVVRMNAGEDLPSLVDKLLHAE